MYMNGNEDCFILNKIVRYVKCLTSNTIDTPVAFSMLKRHQILAIFWIFRFVKSKFCESAKFVEGEIR